jgi:transcriptional regulator with XRE-family HTH domain
VSPLTRHRSARLEDLCKKFGARIRRLRLELGLSQEELAALCELDRTYIGGIERGERNPSLKNIYIVASALGVHVSALLDDSYLPPRASPGLTK